MENRSYFFEENENNNRLRDNNIPNQETFEKLVNSVVFKTEDTELIVPEGGSLGEVLQVIGTDSLDKPVYGWLDISDLVKDDSINLLPNYAGEATGKILQLQEDTGGNKIVEWVSFPFTDLTNYYTKTQVDNTFIKKSDKYQISGQSNNKVATIDNVSNTIPEELVPMKAPERFLGTWNASTNTPTLSVEPIFASDNITVIGYRTRSSKDGVLSRGDYYVATVSGTTLGFTFAVDDVILTNGIEFFKRDRTNDTVVNSVNGETGFVQVEFLRNGDGDLDKSVLDVHIANDNPERIHITTGSQRFEGDKEFIDGISVDEINSSSGGTIQFNDHVAFSGDPSVRVNAFTDDVPTGLTGYTYHQYTGATDEVPTTESVVKFVEKKRYWSTPAVYGNIEDEVNPQRKEEPTIEINNEFEFTDITGLTSSLETLQFELINVSNEMYGQFQQSDGYTANEIDYIYQHLLNKIRATNTGFDYKELLIDVENTGINNIPTTIKDKNLYVGSNIQTGTTYVTFNLLSFNPNSEILESIQYSEVSGGTSQIFIKNFWTDYSIKANEPSYFKKDVYIRESLSVTDRISATKANFGYTVTDYLEAATPINTITNNNNIDANSAVELVKSKLNLVNPQLDDTFYKLPDLDLIVLGTKVTVYNNTNNENAVIVVNETPRDRINSPETTSKTTQYVVAPYKTKEFIAIENGGGNYTWLVK